MAKKKLSGNLSGEIPKALFNEFDELIERLGLVKKRAMAAAVSVFVHADEDVRRQMYEDVWPLYYADDATDGSASPKGSGLGPDLDGAGGRGAKRATKRRASTG